MTPVVPAVPVKPPLSWATEPAKIVGYIVAFVIAVTGLVAMLAVQYADVVPAKYAQTVKTVVAICSALGVVATQIQTWLTRNGFGPTGNGKDGVVSPATHAAELEATAVAVAAAKAVDPAVHAL